MIEILSFIGQYLPSKHLVVLWIVLNACITYYVRELIKPYYNPKTISETLPDGKIISYDIHQKYVEFSRHDDKPSFFGMWIGFCTYAWIRIILWISLAVLACVDCR